MKTRYLPLSEDDRAKMLAKVGVASVEDLFCAIPEQARLKTLPALPSSQNELSVLRHMQGLAGKNAAAGAMPFFCGAGAYRHYVPASVDNIIQRSEFLTAYTPYQPEIAQGTLQVIYEFQSQVAMLTGMDIANASMYDGSTATAEAVLMAVRITKRKRAVMATTLHPHYADAVRSLCNFAGVDVVQAPVELAQLDEETACVVVQNPDFFGEMTDLTELAEACHAKGILLLVAITEIISTGLVRSAGEMGADIVAGEGQSLGNSLNFGGPYVGLLATREKFVRQMPGRLCGRAKDEDGRDGFVLTLAAREQHIRREKATSNICTSAGLCALAFSSHLSLLGGVGLRNLASQNHALAKALAASLSQVAGVKVRTKRFFNEFTMETPMHSVELVDALLAKKILGGVPVARLLPDDKEKQNWVVVAATEMNTAEDIHLYTTALAELLA